MINLFSKAASAFFFLCCCQPPSFQSTFCWYYCGFAPKRPGLGLLNRLHTVRFIEFVIENGTLSFDIYLYYCFKNYHCPILWHDASQKFRKKLIKLDWEIIVNEWMVWKIYNNLLKEDIIIFITEQFNQGFEIRLI